ncbi:MAG: hypothetical protein WDN69_26745 [Aliidongia sp.]
MSAEDLLRALGAGPGKTLPIAEAALAYAALARPALDLTFYRAHLAVLARAVGGDRRHRARGACRGAGRGARPAIQLSRRYRAL